VLKEENLAENAAKLGEYFRETIRGFNNPLVKEVRGKGLLNAIVIDHPDPDAAWNLCLDLKENGLLAKPTHGAVIRFAPPLLINKEQVVDCLGIIKESLNNLK